MRRLDMLSELATALLSNTANVLAKGVSSEIDARSFDGCFFKSFSWLASNYPADMSMLAQYHKTQGCYELREQIAQHFHVTSESVVITAGASEALRLVISALINKGDLVAIPRVGFPAYKRLLHGASLQFYDVCCDGDVLFSNIVACIKSRPKILLFNNPHNPTGAFLRPDKVDELIELAEEHDVHIIYDGAYQWLAGIHNLPESSHVTSVISLGKYVCLPAIRIGFIHTVNPMLMNAIVEIKCHSALHSDPLTERLCSQLMQDQRLNPLQSALVEKLSARREQLHRIDQGIVKQKGFYAYTKRENIEHSASGLNGDIFGGNNSDVRVCLAISDHKWNKLLCTLNI